MKTPHALAATLSLIVIIVSACVPDSPTTPEATDRNPSGPAYDGGVMYGSGNSASTQTAADSTGAPGGERGGVMYGSGN